MRPGPSYGSVAHSTLLYDSEPLRDTEPAVSPGGSQIVATGSFGQWFGLAPDDSPLLARYIGTQENLRAQN
jgi:hypothetical protein